jgi:hypothetical protein
MSLGEFKEETTLFGDNVLGQGRDRMTPIDSYLSIYKDLDQNQSLEKKKDALNDLIGAIYTYLTDESTKHKDSVHKLLLQARSNCPSYSC